MCTLGWIKETGIPDNDVVLFPATTNLSHDGLRRSRSFGISVSRQQEERRHQATQNKKNTALPWNSGHVHACNCLRFGKQATARSPPSRTHPARSKVARPPGTVKKKKKSLLQQCCRLIDRGSDRGEATICSWICGTGTARIRCTRSTCNVQQLREQPQTNCLCVTEIRTAHTTRPHVSCESDDVWNEQQKKNNASTRASAFTLTAD